MLAASERGERGASIEVERAGAYVGVRGSVQRGTVGAVEAERDAGIPLEFADGDRRMGQRQPIPKAAGIFLLLGWRGRGSAARVIGRIADRVLRAASPVWSALADADAVAPLAARDLPAVCLRGL